MSSASDLKQKFAIIAGVRSGGVLQMEIPAAGSLNSLPREWMSAFVTVMAAVYALVSPRFLHAHAPVPTSKTLWRSATAITGCLPSLPILIVMDSSRSQNADTALMSLEADATSARGGFACMFSSAEEYETALISERRAQGRYDQQRSHWPMVMFIGCSLLLAGSVLLLS